MSEGDGPRRSARIASKRQTTGGEERKPKRMKSDASSRAPTSVDVFAKKLRDVFSFRAAIPLLEEYLLSIQIDDDDPAFLFDWQEDNVNAFVAAANNLPAAQAPPWLRTRPDRITASSLIDDIIYSLQPDAGARCGHVVLAPNNLEQFLAVGITLMCLQNDTFLQNAAQAAIPVVNSVEQYLAVSHYLTDSECTERDRTISHRLSRMETHCVGSSSNALSMTASCVRLLTPHRV